jgi:Tol biopolymer transport system component
VLSADGGDEQIVTSGHSADGPRDWFADGKRLLALTTRPDGKRWKIWEVPLAAAPHAESQARILASASDHNFYVPQLSPDERWICCIRVRADEPGLSALFVMPSAGGEMTQITDGKFYDDKVRWSPDGKTIFFLAPRDGCFNVWGIRFDPALGKSVGQPFRVTGFSNPSRMATPSKQGSEMSTAANRLALPLTEVSGSVWVLDNLEP